jgi:Fe-S-cluster containining protein
VDGNAAMEDSFVQIKFGADSPSNELSAALDHLRNEIASGLLYTHNRANSNTSRALESATFLYALIEILTEKGLLSVAELDARKNAIAERVQKRFLSKGMGVIVQESERDKYKFEAEVKIDCENRIHLCKAACCRLDFPLSRQDIDEGIIKWAFDSPYLIAHSPDGYCSHMDRGSCACTVREHRPIPCRAYDCRNDKRIWQDFEMEIINPDIERVFAGKVSPEDG